MNASHASLRRDGFTLIELMIVVGIIGILAAVAIPNFMRFQLRTRVSEGKANIAGIRTSEEAYNAEYGTYIAAPPAPITTSVAPDNMKYNWPFSASGFGTIGWFPEGEVYYRYAVVLGTSTPSGTPSFTVEGWSDIDFDMAYNSWGYVHAFPGDTAGAAGVNSLGTVCAAAGTYNATTMAADLLNTTGPCTLADGQNIF